MLEFKLKWPFHNVPCILTLFKARHVSSFSSHVLKNEVLQELKDLPSYITKLLWGQHWRVLFLKSYGERVTFFFLLKQEMN